jgi:hypothetical protein
MGKIFDAIGEARQIRDALLELDPSLADESSWDVLRDTMEGEAEHDVTALAEWAARKVLALKRDKKFRLAAIGVVQDELAEKKKRLATLERHIESMNGIAFALAEAMTPPGKPVKFQRPGFTAFVQKQGDIQRALLAKDESKTPQQFFSVESIKVFDKEAIKAELVRKEPVEGWELAPAKETFIVKEV